MKYNEMLILNNEAISAIYFALLQCKYNFYSIGRDADTVNKLQSFIEPYSSEYDFFSEIRQNTCAVYPYWPRAAMLETATFYVDLLQICFNDFEAYKNKIISAQNISDQERNQAFWDWVLQFPQALKNILQSKQFSNYLEWENTWILEQNKKYQADVE